MSVHADPEGNKSFIVTLLLAWLFGVFGADRFYLGKNRSAVLKLITFGGFGYWMLVDLLLTIFGRQRDAWGLRLAGYEKHKKTVWITIGAVFGAVLVIGTLSAMAMAAFDSNGPTQLGWTVLAIVAVATAAFGTIWFVRYRRSRAKSGIARHGDDPLPPRIRAHIDKLTALRQMYVLHAAAGNRTAADIVGQVDSLTANMTELFERMGTKHARSQRAVAQDVYDAKLATITTALDRDYLLDVVAKPRLWDKPEQRVRDVQAAIEAVNGQLLENIRQVNARQSLVFQTALSDIRGLR